MYINPKTDVQESILSSGRSHLLSIFLITTHFDTFPRLTKQATAELERFVLDEEKEKLTQDSKGCSKVKQTFFFGILE